MKTADQARAELRHQGETVAHWSKRNNLSADTVRALLRGELQGLYGEAHRAAVMLGIKDGVLPPKDRGGPR